MCSTLTVWEPTVAHLCLMRYSYRLRALIKHFSTINFLLSKSFVYFARHGAHAAGKLAGAEDRRLAARSPLKVSPDDAELYLEMDVRLLLHFFSFIYLFIFPEWGKWDGKVVLLSEQMAIMRRRGGHVYRQHSGKVSVGV